MQHCWPRQWSRGWATLLDGIFSSINVAHSISAFVFSVFLFSSHLELKHMINSKHLSTRYDDGWTTIFTVDFGCFLAGLVSMVLIENTTHQMFAYAASIVERSSICFFLFVFSVYFLLVIIYNFMITILAFRVLWLVENLNSRVLVLIWILCIWISEREQSVD